MLTLGPADTLPTAVPGSNATLQFTSFTAGTHHICGIVTSGAAYCHGIGREVPLGLAMACMSICLTNEGSVGVDIVVAW